MPSFLIVFSAAITSPENSKFFAVDTPFANDENKTHLILILLSPLTVIVFLNFLILFLITSEFDIED